MTSCIFCPLFRVRFDVIREHRLRLLLTAIRINNDNENTCRARYKTAKIDLKRLRAYVRAPIGHGARIGGVIREYHNTLDVFVNQTLAKREKRRPSHIMRRRRIVNIDNTSNNTIVIRSWPDTVVVATITNNGRHCLACRRANKRTVVVGMCCRNRVS